MINDIKNNIEIINAALAWAKKYNKESFPTEQFKDYRRRLKRIGNAMTGNCCAAAYGESQVGKSYLMSSLLSSADNVFVIENGGRRYSFIDELNPSGGKNAQIESTGVITRFTLHKNDPRNQGRIKILNLSVVDIICLLTDSYYNDVKINAESQLSTEGINNYIENVLSEVVSKEECNTVITEDDIYEIRDYVRDVVGKGTADIVRSNFFSAVAAVINRIPYTYWTRVFSVLWNNNPDIDRLFATLINAYKKLDFAREVYVPFDAVISKKGTLLKISWLDTVCGGNVDTGSDEVFTDVYDSEGHLLAQNFSKGELSALIAELTFELPGSVADERPFLRHIDLLDFPGARSREIYKEKEIEKVLPKILRRGKVAYLFNKYSRSLKISSVLFCHHNNQKAGATVGESVNTWIEDNIGSTPAERSRMLAKTNGISPLFMVATKFNIDLQRTKQDTPSDLSTLDEHWDRFDTVFPEIIKPNRWLDEWSAEGATSAPFRGIYPLRDFYWSGKNQLFDGYNDGEIKSGETGVHTYPDFVDYLDRLKDSFLRNRFVRAHFSNPERTWQSVATVNNDGSKPIIRDLDAISTVLDEARRTRYYDLLNTIKNEIINTLKVYYEPEDAEERNRKVKLIAGDIRRSLGRTMSLNPSAFGKILDSLMLSPESFRNIAYDIIIRHTDSPRDFSDINFYRASAEIDISDPRDVNIRKLCDYLILDTEDEVRDYLAESGIELDHIIAGETLTLSTMGDVITKHLLDHWINHINSVASKLGDVLPHSEEVVFMLIKLFDKVGLRGRLADKINTYTEIFDISEQPNAIGDHAAMVFNNFVSTVGRNHIPESEMGKLDEKARLCGLRLDFSPAGWNESPRRQPVTEILINLDESAKQMVHGRIDPALLAKLPFWNNYRRWETFVIAGLVYSSDISHIDPECNEYVRKLIERTEKLYN